MNEFALMTLRPKWRALGIGSLSVGKNGEAQFFGADQSNRLGGEILATMTRVRIDQAAAEGIYLSGMEPAGIDRQGNEKFVYQEWWLRYVRAQPEAAAQTQGGT